MQLRKALTRTVYYPYWFVELFTWAKSFRQNPIIGSYWLNRCGLHVARVVIAHALFRFRLLLLAPLVPAADRQEFLRNGFILKRDFLPADAFARLKAGAEGYQGLDFH